MKGRFLNKYRIESSRLQDWDYGWNSSYFATIRTKSRKCFSGEIIMKEMNLTEIGEIAQKFWQTIPEHFSFVELDEFVVMPNHVHGLLRIKKPYKEQVVIVEPPNLGVSTSHQTNTPGTTSGGRNPKWKPGTLGVIINQYKRICTINARKIDKDFGWQERFFDHIISNRGSYSKIKNYIRNNPLTWENDKLFQ